MSSEVRSNGHDSSFLNNRENNLNVKDGVYRHSEKKVPSENWRESMHSRLFYNRFRQANALAKGNLRVLTNSNNEYKDELEIRPLLPLYQDIRKTGKWRQRKEDAHPKRNARVALREKRKERDDAFIADPTGENLEQNRSFAAINAISIMQYEFIRIAANVKLIRIFDLMLLTLRDFLLNFISLLRNISGVPADVVDVVGDISAATPIPHGFFNAPRRTARIIAIIMQIYISNRLIELTEYRKQRGLKILADDENSDEYKNYVALMNEELEFYKWERRRYFGDVFRHIVAIGVYATIGTIAILVAMQTLAALYNASAILAGPITLICFYAIKYFFFLNPERDRLQKMLEMRAKYGSDKLEGKGILQTQEELQALITLNEERISSLKLKAKMTFILLLAISPVFLGALAKAAVFTIGSGGWWLALEILLNFALPGFGTLAAVVLLFYKIGVKAENVWQARLDATKITVIGLLVLGALITPLIFFSGSWIAAPIVVASMLLAIYVFPSLSKCCISNDADADLIQSSTRQILGFLFVVVAVVLVANGVLGLPVLICAAAAGFIILAVAIYRNWDAIASCFSKKSIYTDVESDERHVEEEDHLNGVGAGELQPKESTKACIDGRQNGYSGTTSTNPASFHNDRHSSPELGSNDDDLLIRENEVLISQC